MKDNFESALVFAIEKHRGQLDKGWTPYIQHVMGVWSRTRNESLTTQIAALLHDTVEDTSATLAEIEEHFGDSVRDIVAILTHTGNQTYDAYIASIASSGNREAILIKIADLEDNSSPERLKRLPESRRAYFEKRIEQKYLKAKLILQIALRDLND